jgi:hypothetical protein
VALCGVSVLWIPLVQASAGGQLFVYIQAVQGYLGTPIGALFLMAVFSTGLNEQVRDWDMNVLRRNQETLRNGSECLELISTIKYGTLSSALRLIPGLKISVCLIESPAFSIYCTKTTKSESAPCFTKV